MRRQFLLGLLLLTQMSTAHTEATTRDGQELYTAYCVACHGPAGQSQLITATQLGVMPADFSDPLFNSREPGDDWFLVIKHGGWALGLSEHMPAFGESFTDVEINTIVAYIKSLADTTGYPPGELNFVALLRTAKPYPEDEVVWQTRWEDADGTGDELKTTLEFEKRFDKSMQTLLELSYKNVNGENYFNEFEFGIKYVLATDLQRRDIFTGTLTACVSLTGDDVVEILPSLRYARQLSEPLVLQASMRAKLPKSAPATGELELATGLQWIRSVWARSVMPALELISEVPLEREGDPVRFSLLPQFRYGLTRGGHVAIKFGAELPLNDRRYDYRFYTSIHWDYADGTLLSGW